MSTRGRLLLVAVTALCALLAALPGLPVAVAAVGALPLVLLLPGHSWISAWYADERFRPEAVLALAIGLSLAFVGLMGLALNWTGPGLTHTTWAIALGGWSALLYAVAALRRSAVWPADGTRVMPSGSALAAFTAVALGFIVALAIAQHGGRKQPRPDFWALAVKRASDASAVMTVTNHSPVRQSATLTVADPRRTLHREDVQVAPFSSIAVRVDLPASAGDDLTADLRSPAGARLRAVRLPEAR